MGKYTIKGHGSFLISFHKYIHYNEKKKKNQFDRIVNQKSRKTWTNYIKNSVSIVEIQIFRYNKK
ncbi:hypothetical protein DQ182_05275 [Enterococcus faecium]|nr:hypothetical protein [Enterococcus faecium]EGP5711453.1 hypothetical protein [Enterococcus faecium]